MEKRDGGFDALIRSRGDIVYLRPCLDVVCYWEGSAFARSAGIVDFYRKSVSLIQDSLSFYRTETMAISKRLKKDTLDLIPFWFAETRTRRDIYMLNLESGFSPDDISDRAFALTAVEADDESSGFVRLILPTNAFGNDFSPFYILAKSLFEGMEFAFGSAGYSLNWNDLSNEANLAREAMSGMRKRYPGLDLSDPSATKFSAATGFKCVNWLTFLGDELASQAGGVISLGKKFGGAVTVESLPHGLVVRAGEIPAIGDVNRRIDVPFYHQVGRVLAPLRAQNHPPFLGVDGIVDDEESNEWLARFDA